MIDDDEARTPLPPSTFGQLYYQLTAELDVRFRRYVEDMGLRILARMDEQEHERRDEGRAFDARLRAVEVSNPTLLADTVRRLDKGHSTLRGQIRLLGWAGGSLATLLSLGLTALAWIKP